ncbi:MAG: hypothetical protein IPK07_33330 [Deltaproteobacteria bacterium]|nr:hypothetical protein [Deltaproteobacteria bacterium]
MRRLSGVDADLLYAETPTAHLHVGALLILDPSTSAAPFGVGTWRALIENHLAELPPLRQRLAEVPFGIDRPYWVDDPHFDLDRHVRRIAVPAPGGPRELGALVGDLCSYKLDRTAPLWETWFIEGVEGGRVAVLFKAHHAAMDGMTGALMLGRLLATEPSEPRADGPRWQPEPEAALPPAWLRFASGLRHLAGAPLDAARPLRDTVRSIRRVAETLGRDVESATPMPFTAPRTSLNRDITPHRRFAFVEVPLADVKRVKERFGVKVNDVAVALCAERCARTCSRTASSPPSRSPPRSRCRCEVAPTAPPSATRCRGSSRPSPPTSPTPPSGYARSSAGWSRPRSSTSPASRTR